jgi:hypothetical protein
LGTRIGKPPAGDPHGCAPDSHSTYSVHLEVCKNDNKRFADTCFFTCPDSRLFSQVGYFRVGDDTLRTRNRDSIAIWHFRSVSGPEVNLRKRYCTVPEELPSARVEARVHFRDSGQG